MGTDTVQTQFVGIDIESIFLFVYKGILSLLGIGPDVFISIWNIAEFIASLLIPVLLVGLVYSLIRIQQLKEEDEKKFEEQVHARGHIHDKHNERWERIVKLSISENPADWRVAIIDADTILDMQLSERFGFAQETMGDRLKRLTTNDMRTLDAAWDAHKVRNQIAHGGSDFILTQREARRVVDLYRQVFEELGFL